MSPVVESRLWTSDEEERLRALVVSGKHPAAIGKLLGRSEKAIRNRLHMDDDGRSRPRGGWVYRFSISSKQER